MLSESDCKYHQKDLKGRDLSFWGNIKKRFGKKARTKLVKKKYSVPVLEQTKLQDFLVRPFDPTPVIQKNWSRRQCGIVDRTQNYQQPHKNYPFNNHIILDDPCN
ncbi:Uncharacterized protein Fot_17912 [Forsythia ovata]|uniref:Uncharacterized protein n=1 Tax=Forsythia ovata TaxID=205694 RepID=A0ABD1VGP3_9LAMI